MSKKAIYDWNSLLKKNNIDADTLDNYIRSKEFELIAGKVVDDKNKNYIISESKIQGVGVFAEKLIKKKEVIGFCTKDNTRTYLGRYTNHNPDYNVKFLYIKNSPDTIALAFKDIKKGEEIVADYRNHTFNKEFYDK